MEDGEAMPGCKRLDSLEDKLDSLQVSGGRVKKTPVKAEESMILGALVGPTSNPCSC